MRTTFIVPGARSGGSYLASRTSAPLGGPVIEPNAPMHDGFPTVALPIESWGEDFEKLAAVQGRPVERAYFLPHSSAQKISVQPVVQDPGNFDDPLEWEIPADSSKILPGAMVFARHYPEGEIRAGWRFWILRPSDNTWLSLHSSAANYSDLMLAIGPLQHFRGNDFLDQVYRFAD